MNPFYRIFFLQLLAYILIIIISYMVQLIPKMQYHNQWVYNINMPVEAGILSWAAYNYFKLKKERFLVWIGYAGFLIVLISELFIKGAGVFSNHGYIAQSVLLLVFYLLIIYTQFNNQTKKWKYSADVWISIGIVLYFGGVVPYLSLFNYLLKFHPRINLYLFRFITVELSNVRYIFLAIGFWLIRRNAMLKNSPANE